MRLVNPKNNKRYSVDFIILKGNFKSLLGLQASQEMKLLSINKQNISAVEFGNLGNLSKSFITTEYQDVFKGEGKLDGELHRRKLMKQSDLSNCSQDEFKYE